MTDASIGQRNGRRHVGARTQCDAISFVWVRCPNTACGDNTAIFAPFKTRFTEVLKLRFNPRRHHHEAWSAAQAPMLREIRTATCPLSRERRAVLPGRKTLANGNLFGFGVTRRSSAAFQVLCSHACEARPTMRDHSGNTWLRVPRHLSFIVAIALGGCVPHAADVQSRSEPIPATAVSAPSRSDTQICRPSAALLAPPSAPDCVFKRTALRTIDPGRWTRLKVEYELQCYQNAEHAIRQRLRLLQAANRCQVASAR
jgi:hypothetical protein